MTTNNLPSTYHARKSHQIHGGEAASKQQTLTITLEINKTIYTILDTYQRSTTGHTLEEWLRWQMMVIARDEVNSIENHRYWLEKAETLEASR